MPKNMYLQVYDLKAEHDICSVGLNLSDFHYHNTYEIYILRNGERTLFVNDEIHPTSDGDVYLMRPHMLHRSTGNTPYRGISIHFSDGYLKNHFNSADIKDMLSVFSKSVIHLDDKEMEIITYLADKITLDQSKTHIYLPAILEIIKTKIPTYAIDAPVYNSKFYQVMDYVNENFTLPVTLQELADKFYISPNYLGHLFKKQTGTSFNKYVNRLRVQHACYLMRQVEYYSTAEIMEKCGYLSPSYFSRIFTELAGMSPKEYRKKAANKTME